ncbi:MAG: glycosyltransferase, partial [Verrucomicrobia bacterium]|nr:glycosyltransferase [Verrucomicrobiota bacterium]
MRIAFVGSLPAAAVFPIELVREHYRRGNHPAPWVQGLLPALAATSGFKLRVILVQRAILRPCLVERDGVEYQGVPYHLPERSNIRLFHLPKSLVYRTALRQFQPDLVHAFGMETGSGTIALRSGFPVSCFVQGILEKLYPLFPPRALGEVAAERWCESRAVRRIRWFVAENEWAREWVLSCNPAARVTLIPHSLRNDFLAKAAPTYEKRVLSVGGLTRIKGMDTIIKAFARIKDKEAKLCLVGTGPLMQELKKLAQSLGVGERVEFTGNLDTERVIAQMNRASVFVVASRVDTSPNVLSEAHAIGLPVIGTKGGGIPEMIEEGLDGYQVEVDGFEEMALRMDHLL